MNTLPLFGTVQRRVLATAGALVFCCAPILAQDAAPAHGQRTDGQIEMDVVQALDASPALKNDLITAATIQGQVTLSGTVASDADRQLAESIVNKVNGVAGVKNNLTVGNPAQDPNQAGAPSDQGELSADGPANNPDQQAQAPSTGAEPSQPAQEQSQIENNSPQQQPRANGQRPDYSQPRAGSYPPPPPAYGSNYPPPPPPPGYRRPQYGRPAPAYSIPNEPVTIASGTVVQVRTNDWVDSKKAQPGTPLDFTVLRDVMVNGYLAIPRGATVHGTITEVKHAGQLSGTPELALRLTSLDLSGRNYPLDSDEFKVKGPNKTAHTAGNAIAGALIGAVIGGAAGGGGGAAIGAVAGGSVGTAASAASNPRAWIPAEALVTFHLNAPLTVDPVSREEANRLAQGLYPGGPQLYRRGFGYNAYPPVYYPYPQPYYRPYYLVNGYYYWR